MVTAKSKGLRWENLKKLVHVGFCKRCHGTFLVEGWPDVLWCPVCANMIELPAPCYVCAVCKLNNDDGKPVGDSCYGCTKGVYGEPGYVTKFKPWGTAFFKEDVCAPSLEES